MHGRLDLPEHQTVFDHFRSVPVICISDAQRQPVPQARWLRTIHHGLPADLLRPVPETPSYLAVLGRISPEKAIDRSIRIAQRCGLPLKIAAKVDRADRDYFEYEIKPLLSLPGVEFVGEISDREKSAFLSGALALLLPIDWPEPFGLVMIEALACGTPVVAFPSGSVREVIEDGVTGLIVDSEKAAADAIATRLASLSRQAIRARFEERFTARRMASDYLDVYRQLIADPRRKRPGAAATSKVSPPTQDRRHQNGTNTGLYVGD
jgi:glycosyltransferase involved in cell wall biosynthesis